MRASVRGVRSPRHAPTLAHHADRPKRAHTPPISLWQFGLAPLLFFEAPAWAILEGRLTLRARLPGT
eukprot:3550823-Alexandrium_andersonii.AAC.1